MSINRTALHQAMESQQRQIEAQRRQISQLVAHASLQDGIIDYVAKLAGISKQVTAIRKKADVLNPAQPIPDPNPVPPSETTQEAATPEAYDDVRNPGATPGSLTHVPAEATTVALQPGEDLPTQPFNQLVDVQAPVENTSTQLPLNQTRIETDVRVGDPMNQEIAYPWTMSQNNSNGQRTASQGKQAAFLSEHPEEGGHDGGGTHGWGVWNHDNADWSDHPAMAYGDHEEAPAWDRADAEQARDMTLNDYRDNGFDEDGDMHKVMSVQPYNRGEDIQETRNRIPRHAPHTAQKKQASAVDESRTIASMRLARLQIEAGLAEESDDLSLGQKIASSERTDSEINQTIKTLESVKKAASKKQARPAHLVPRTASAGSRSTPSFAGGSGSDLSATASLSVEATQDTEDADLFL